MRIRRPKKSRHLWNGRAVLPGQAIDLELKIGESYSGAKVRIPLHVKRGRRDGPAVFVSAALHGDELNGTGAIRELILSDDLELIAGALVLVPVLNVLAFDQHSRYLPDRRDLNRCFPGSPNGSMASRLARKVFEQLVPHCDFGIDLHTAAVRRTNFPNVRADLRDPRVERLAKAFGSELILVGQGPDGSFRREATAAGCPTVTFEGGEVWKVEPTIVECITRGVRNVLLQFGMLEGAPVPPREQRVLRKTKWVRADRSGFLQFHVSPGEIVERGQPLATNNSLLGRERNVLLAPFPAVVIGMTTLPAVSPGEAVCHLGRIETTPRETRASFASDQLHQRVQDELATNLMVVEPADHDDDAAAETR